ncbi:MAG TPA: PD-(D/E)XK nuclease family protein [Verrucomicrobiae bacterium]|nr:PD-(D/E)XK nuclease family protein [Verrucomicrobiae bacterium]
MIETDAPPPPLRGPVRILGGPAAGKTDLLARLHRDLVAGGTDPARILVVVDSSRARADVSRRLTRSAPGAEPLAVVWTLGDLARWVIGSREDAGPGPQVLTGFGTWLAARATLERARRQLPRLAPLHADAACIEDASRAVAALRQALVGPGLLAARLHGAPVALAELAVIAARSQDVLESARAIDLDGAVALAAEHLLEDPSRVAARFDAALIDDAQDWGPAQFHLVRALALGLPPPGRLAVAGDPRQALGGAGGGSARWFEEELPLSLAVADWVLPESRRRPPAVLAAAAALDPIALSRAAGEPASPAGSALPGVGPAVEIWRAEDESAEALGVARAIKAWVLQGSGRYADVAILLRGVSPLGPVFVEALALTGVPCGAGRLGWSRHPALGSLRAWLRWSAAPADPQRVATLLEAAWGGLSPAARRWLRRRSGAHGSDLLRTVRVELAEAQAQSVQREGREADGTLRAELRRLARRLARAQAAATALSPGPVDPHRLLIWVGQVAAATGLFAAAPADPVLAAVLRGVTAALRAITDVEARLRGRPPTLEVALDLLEVALQRAVEEDDEPDPDRDAVHLLTIRQARGLAFARVFVAGCAVGIFPARARPLGLLAPDELALLLERVPELQDTILEVDRQGEEEARHLVVALTRATQAVTCTYAERYDGRVAQPSSLLRPLRAAGVVERAVPALPDLTRSDLAAALAAAVTARPALRPEAVALPQLDLGRLLATLPEFDPVEGAPAVGSAPLQLSTTALNEWLACPRRLYYHRVVRPGPPTPAQLRGEAAHRLLEQLHRVEASWRADPDRFRAAADECLERHILPWLAPEIPGRLELRAAEAWLRRLVDRYARHWVAVGGGVGETLGVELDFRLALEGLELRGRIDRVRSLDEGAVEVLDYKTARAVPARGAILAAIHGSDQEGPSDWQLPVYALALARGAVTPLPAIVPALARTWYVGHSPASVRWPDRPLDRRGLRIDGDRPLPPHEADELRELPAAALGSFVDRFEQEGRRIASGRFPAQPRHAHWTCLDPDHGCSRRSVCAGVGSVGRGHPVPRP